MFDKEVGKQVFDRVYESIIERCSVDFWYEPWSGINVIEAWMLHIDSDMLNGHETDIVAWLVERFMHESTNPALWAFEIGDNSWFYDGVPYTMAVAMHKRFAMEHEIKE